MSHEIRTPMTSILGYADLLTDSSLSPSSRNNYLAVIRRSGENLLTLINDILDLSKIEAGKLSLDVRRCDVVSLVADVASVVRPRAEGRGVSLSIEYSGQMPETILTDGARLRQAVLNLASNAVKFTERGSVRIAASFLPRWRESQPAVRIEVIDTGIGIRAEILPRLFQPFTQGDAAIFQKFGGTGLGLAISHEITRLLGGDLTVASAWGTRKHLHPDCAHGQPRGHSHAGSPRRGGAGYRRPQVGIVAGGPPGCPYLAGRRRPRQSATHRDDPPQGRRRGRIGRERPAGRGPRRGPTVRLDPHGYQHAGNGRFRGDPSAPRSRLHATDPGAYGQRHVGRRGALSGSWLQRTPRQADRPPPTAPNNRRLRRPEDCRWRGRGGANSGIVS